MYILYFTLYISASDRYLSIIFKYIYNIYKFMLFVSYIFI